MYFYYYFWLSSIVGGWQPLSSEAKWCLQAACDFAVDIRSCHCRCVLKYTVNARYHLPSGCLMRMTCWNKPTHRLCWTLSFVVLWQQRNKVTDTGAVSFRRSYYVNLHSFGPYLSISHSRIWHSEDRASWYILIIKPTRCTNLSNLFLE